MNNIESICYLTPSQEGILYQCLESGDPAAYFLQTVLEVELELDDVLISETMKLLSAKYNVLRTAVLNPKKSRPTQVILTDREIEIQMVSIPVADLRGELEALCRQDLKRGFRLDRDSLLRIIVIHVQGESKTSLIWSAHHIILDGWCISLLSRDFFRFYDLLIANRSEEARKLAEKEKKEILPFPKYVAWLQQQDWTRGLAYWEQLLKGYEGFPRITSFSGKTISKDEGMEKQDHAVSMAFPLDLMPRLQEAVKENHVTQNCFFEAAWGLTLQHYSRERDVVFHRVDSGRGAGLPGIEQSVGLYLNMIPVRVTSGEEETCEQLLKKIFMQQLDGAAFLSCPVSEIQSRAGIKPSSIRTLFSFENYEGSENLFGSHARQVRVQSHREQTNYDITVTVAPDGEGGFTCELIYAASLYTKGDAERILRSFMELAKKLVLFPKDLVKHLDSLNAQDLELVERVQSAVKAPWPKDLTVTGIMQKVMKQNAERTALVCEGRSITYRELDEKSNRLANRLRSMGVGRNTCVALYMERSLAMVEAIYSVVKAGGAYVPIHTIYPKERVQYMIADCRPSFILTGGVTLDTDENIPIINLDVEENWGNNPKVLDVINEPGDLLYIIYTSGTTGNPKGVMIEHRNVVRLFFHEGCRYDFTERDVWLMFHSYSFDFSVWEMYGAGLFGGKLVVLTQEETLDSGSVLKSIQKEQVTVLNQVPSAFYQLQEKDEGACCSVRYLIFGGEALQPSRLKKWHRLYPSCRIVNMYGITETTVHVTYQDIGEKEIEDGISRMGLPIPTLGLCVMDGDRLCGIGQPGEVCVTGAGLGRGYLYQEELTRQKFVPSPWGEGRMYRSGDLARWLADGSLEYIGRMDEQIKVRGFRIELGEIETVLQNLAKVESAAVILQSREDGEKAIHAYFTAREELDVRLLKEEMAKKLPSYMLPVYWKQLEKMPLTYNGKLDRKRLPVIEELHAKKEEAPSTEEENVVARAFCSILGVRNVSRHDNFYELGGDSIKAVRVVSEIQQAGYAVTVRDVLQSQNVMELAACLEAEAMKDKSEDQAEQIGFVELSPIQREWASWHLPEPAYYNQSILLKTKQKMDLTRTQEILQELLLHHDLLRSVYREEKLWIRPMKDMPLSNVKEVFLNLQAAQQIYEETMRMQKEIQPETGNMLRLLILHAKEEDYLFITIHHLVIDWVSWNILLDDFIILYQQHAKGESALLPAKTASYNRWVQSLKTLVGRSDMQADLAHWQQTVATIKNISWERKIREKAGPWQHHKVTVFTALCGEDVTRESILQATQHSGCEMEVFLLSALRETVEHFIGEENLSVLMESQGREALDGQIDLSRTVGWFTAVYPVAFLGKQVDYLELLLDTKQTMRKVPHHGITYGMLKDDGHAENLACDPFFCLNYMGDYDVSMLQNPVFSVSSLETAEPISPRNPRRQPMSFDCGIRNNRMEIKLTCEKETVLGTSALAFLQFMNECLARLLQLGVAQEHQLQILSDYAESTLDEDEIDFLNELVDLN